MSEVRKQDDLNNARLLQSERIHLSIFYKDVDESLRSITITEEHLRDLERTKAMGKTFISFFSFFLHKHLFEEYLTIISSSSCTFLFFPPSSM